MYWLLHPLGFQVDHKQGEAIGFLLNLGVRCRSRHHQRVVRAPSASVTNVF